MGGKCMKFKIQQKIAAFWDASFVTFASVMRHISHLHHKKQHGILTARNSSPTSYCAFVCPLFNFTKPPDITKCRKLGSALQNLKWQEIPMTPKSNSSQRAEDTVSKVCWRAFTGEIALLHPKTRKWFRIAKEDCAQAEQSLPTTETRWGFANMFSRKILT